MYAEWKRNPPLPLMVKAYLGIKDTPDVPPGPAQLPGFATMPDIEE
jgi:hypothetical protein